MLHIPESKPNDNSDKVSVVSAYQDGQTYNQVSDLLKGIVKEDQVFIERHVPGQATEIPDPIVQYEEPVHL